MSISIPNNKRQEIRKIAYKALDDADYLAMSQEQASEFMNLLLNRQDIGGELAKYIKRERIRTYIKDSVVNNYSKEKTKEAIPKDPRPILKSLFDIRAEESHKEAGLQLYKSINADKPNEYVVISEGTILKWETALRKALLFISAKPFSKSASDVHILLLLFAQHKPLTLSDKNNLETALIRCGAKPYIFGER
jgi:hypothetical protein